MDKRRMAVMKASRELVEGFMEPVKINACIACALGARTQWVHDALKLPANAVVNAVAYDFYRDQVLLRIECPDFREVAQGERCPEVEAFYRRDTSKGEYLTSTESQEWSIGGVFDHWEGEAVGRPQEAMTYGQLVNRSRAALGLPPLTDEQIAAEKPKLPDTLLGRPIRYVDKVPEAKTYGELLAKLQEARAVGMLEISAVEKPYVMRAAELLSESIPEGESILSKAMIADAIEAGEKMEELRRQAYKNGCRRNYWEAE